MSEIELLPGSADRKARYVTFCDEVYIPIYSKPWWMDAVCGPENWDVWLHEDGSGRVDAAMPYYLERREHGLYITKAPLTQTNGITFRHPHGASRVTKEKFEDAVIRDAMAFVDGLGLAVYEQQWHWSFHDWSPLRWCGCVAEPRYTYVISDASSPDAMWASMDRRCRKLIKRGQRSCELDRFIGFDEFWVQHAKVFAKQGLPVPFSRELFQRLWNSALERGCAQPLCMRTVSGEVASLVFEVWDEYSMYSLVGGSVPEYQSLDSYHAVRWEAMKLAGSMGLMFDFEGSVIERIARSVREYGGEPKLYFRIRKVYNPEVILAEAAARVEGM